jgi:hypothetical protein
MDKKRVREIRSLTIIVLMRRFALCAVLWVGLLFGVEPLSVQAAPPVAQESNSASAATSPEASQGNPVVKVIPARFSPQIGNFFKSTKDRKPPTDRERNFKFLKSGERAPVSACLQDPAQCRCPDGLQRIELTDGFPQPLRGAKPPYELKLSKGMGGQRSLSCVTPCPQGKTPRIKYDTQGKASFQCEG